MALLRFPVFIIAFWGIIASCNLGCENSHSSEDELNRKSSPFENYDEFELSTNVKFYGDNSYAVFSKSLQLFSQDSSITAFYSFPKIKYLADSTIELKVNELLEVQFLKNMIGRKAFQEYSAAKKEKKSSAFWETTEVNYTIGLTTKKFITLAYEYIHEQEDSEVSKFENKYFNINLETGELIDSLDYFFVDGYEPTLERQLNNATETYTEGSGYYFKIDPDIDYQFGFFEDDFGINLKIYIPPDSTKIADGTSITKMSDLLPKLFYAPLDSIAELIDTSCVLKTLLEPKVHELQ